MSEKDPAATAVELELADEAATAALAARIAELARPPDVIGLSGDLGTGKTTFARAFIRARAGAAWDEEVPSPTFTLVQIYDLAGGRVHHFDLFRVENPEAARELGVDEAFAEGISLIEWPERLAGAWPADRLEIELSHGRRVEARGVRLIGLGRWRNLLARAFAEPVRG